MPTKYKKSQTATEYMIILAVVIIIALVVISLLGGFHGIGGNINQNTAKIKLANQNIAVVNFVLSDDTIGVFELQNNFIDSVRIDAIEINNEVCNLGGSTPTLKIGDKKKIYCRELSALTSGDNYDYEIKINYTNMATAASYQQYEKGVNLVGRVASATLGPELVTNGEFDSDLSGWTNGGFTYDTGTAKKGSVGGGTLQQDVGISIGETYKLTYSIPSISGANVVPSAGGFTGAQGDVVGSYEELFTASSTANLIMTVSVGSYINLDDISVKQVLLE